MRKRVLCVMLAAAVAAGTVACGSKSSGSTKAATEAVTEASKAEETTKAQEETTKEETTEAETEAEEADGEEFQTGTWDELTFTNPWMNIAITFPEDSYIYSEDEMKTVLGAGQDILVNNGNYTNSQLKIAEALTVYDFMVALPDGQSNVQLAYENINITTGGKGIEPAEYLDAVSAQLVQIQDMQYEMGEKTEVELGGQTFTKMTASLMGGAFYQDYYCVRIGNHMATMTISYLPDSASMVEELVAGITEA